MKMIFVVLLFVFATTMLINSENINNNNITIKQDALLFVKDKSRDVYVANLTIISNRKISNFKFVRELEDVKYDIVYVEKHKDKYYTLIKLEVDNKTAQKLSKIKFVTIYNKKLRVFVVDKLYVAYISNLHIVNKKMWGDLNECSC